MSKPSSTVALEIFREVEPLFAQIGRSLEGVSGKTWIRWNKDRPKHQPKPDSISQVARKMWDTIESREGKCIRDLVLATIKRVAPSAPVESWKSAQDCGAWFHNHANEPHAVSHSLPIQKSNAAPANLPSTLANPFTWLDAIDDPDAFFGREKELRKLRDYLRTRSNVQIVGPRRIGKSSLLLAVGHRVKEWLKQPAFAFVDMEMANCHTVKGWLRYVAREWDWPKPPDNLADFADCVGADVRAGRQLVLCLDEFEKFAELPGEFTKDFFENLRGCSQKGVSILTAARRPLREIRRSGALLSPYYNTFARLDLGPFTDKEAREFVNLARPGVPKFAEEETDAILESAQGHPLRLMFACYEVLEAKWNGEPLAEAIRRAERRADELLPPPN